MIEKYKTMKIERIYKNEISINVTRMRVRIMRMLGYPMVNVEVRNEDVEECIIDAIKHYIAEAEEHVYNESKHTTNEILETVRSKFKNNIII